MSSTAEKFAIGIDIGATKIASVVLSENGRLIASSQIPTLASEGREAVLDKVANQILDLAKQAPGGVVGVGMGSPGKVDSTYGVVYDAVNLGWAHGALLTTFPGDTSMATVEQVRAFASGGSARIQR